MERNVHDNHRLKLDGVFKKNYFGDYLFMILKLYGKKQKKGSKRFPLCYWKNEIFYFFWLSSAFFKSFLEPKARYIVRSLGK